MDTCAERPYLLSRHAHLCIRGDHVVILDLASGEYLALNVADARQLAAWIQGWPVAGEEHAEPGILRRLVDAGLVTKDRAHGREVASPAAAPTPVESLSERTAVRAIKVRTHHVLSFLLAIFSVQLALRWIGLRHIVNHVRRRKAAYRGHEFDPQKARELISIFNYLYPWFLGRKDECLRNSLMLLLFLARYKVFCDWIFAVRTDPFFAHCWLQHEDVVLNDRVRTVAGLTPIMVV
jgi:hypothetical protein